MKRFVCFGLLVFLAIVSVKAQSFEEEINIPAGYVPEEVLLPPSPLSRQILFIGGVDKVQTTSHYGNEAGEVYAKEWHDFIGFTPNADQSIDHMGWVSVNHESRYLDDRLGDGGGMTAFAVKYGADGNLEVVEQTLSDGREGKFFNVDFVNTVGETGMNCGGIVGPDGRIWTAEEWWVADNETYNEAGGVYPMGGAYPSNPGQSWANLGIRNTNDYTISSDIPAFDGQTISAYENVNYMVEIDPKEAVAIRKQYNWGRQGFESGTITNDNSTVYLGVDLTPGYWCKYVADAPGDFINGTTYVYKQDNPAGQRWIEIDNADPSKMVNFLDEAAAVGATMLNRIEWLTIDRETGIIYMTETGRDNPGAKWSDEHAEGATYAQHHIDRATAQGVTDPGDGAYWDYYGRILAYDPATDEITVHLEGGPYFAASPAEADYPSKHLSNPDGLSMMEIDGQNFLLICEDLNGSSYGRVPAGVSNRTCELFLLDVSIASPTVDDLIRLTAVPAGAEVTGVTPVTDGDKLSILANSQHPSTANEFPYNHSLTFAIHGFENISLSVPEVNSGEELFGLYPNPATRVVHLSETMDVAIYDIQGKRLKVYRDVNEIDVSEFSKGNYFIKNNDNEVKKLIIQ